MNYLRDDKKAISVTFAALTDKGTIMKNPTKTAVAMHAELFGYMAELYGSRFVHPKGSTRKHTYERVLKFMFDNFFVLDSDEVEEACGKAMIRILENVFRDFLDSDIQAPEEEQILHEKDKLHSVFIKPLLQLISSNQGQTHLNAGAAHCLHLLYQHLHAHHPKCISAPMVGEITATAFKTRTHEEHYVEMLCEMHKSMGYYIASLNVNYCLYLIETLDI